MKLHMMCPYWILLSAWQPLTAPSSNHLLFPHFPPPPFKNHLVACLKKWLLPIPSHRSDLYEISLLFQRGLCITYTEINTMKECCVVIYLLFAYAFQSTNYRISSISKMLSSNKINNKTSLLRYCYLLLLRQLSTESLSCLWLFVAPDQVPFFTLSQVSMC